VKDRDARTAEEPVAAGGAIEVLLHDAGLHAHLARLGVDLADRSHMPRRVEHQADVFAHHRRHADATRAAVRAWGRQVVCLDEREHPASLTAVLMPDRVDADELRRTVVERYHMSLGAGVGRIAGRAFRIGHLGDFNDLMLAGTLCGVEMGLRATGVPLVNSGVKSALALLAGEPVPA